MHGGTGCQCSRHPNGGGNEQGSRKIVIANPAKKRNKKIRLVTGFFYFI